MKLRAIAASLAFCANASWCEPFSLTVDADLRTDKVPGAGVVRKLPAGSSVDVLSLEGGWVWVSAKGARGWLRASVLNLKAGTSIASEQAKAAREMMQPAIGTLSVRGLPPRGNRYALLIGIGRYADPAAPELPGVAADLESATQMALAMQVPAPNIARLQDERATVEGIRGAMHDLESRMGEGDRVFIHFSGHGSRFEDPTTGDCQQALLTHEGGRIGRISQRDLAALLAPLARKADKVFVMIDACYAGGVATEARTRGVLVPGDEGRLRPKFVPADGACARPSNVKSRGLFPEVQERGVLPQNIVHVASSRDDEISLDDEHKGGLATQFLRDCMLRDAQDIDGSGAISIEELQICAQQKINTRMAADSYFAPQHLVVSGNSSFVPRWLPQGEVGTVADSKVVAGLLALQQVYDQRDAKRRVKVQLSTAQLTIGREPLEFTVESDRPGYVYVALAGSDNESLYLLFPNELDGDNRIEAGRALALPRPSWTVRGGGPAGFDHLLVMVADSPRDAKLAGAARAGPFMKSFNNAAGRASIGAWLTSGRDCAGAKCSDAFGAALVPVEEIR